MSLSSKVLTGLFSGIITGFIFGEYVGFFAVPGEIFIALLQMTVLPYVIVSLVKGLGGLEPRQAIRLAKMLVFSC